MASDSGWSNRSVLAFAGDGDPLQRASAAARKLLEAAIAQGMTAPPVDPLALAKMLGLGVVPHNDIADASIAEDRREPATRGTKAPLKALVPSLRPLVIAYNPSRPKGRLRFSIAHEIAHALFADVADTVRHRTPTGAVAGISDTGGTDEWELELLCNIVAAELLLPDEAVEGLLDIDTDVDFIMETRRRWDVSTEALLRRLVMAARRPLTLVAASRITVSDPSRLRVEYTVTPAARDETEAPVVSLRRGRVLELPNPFAECTAVGQTARGAMSADGRTWSAQTVGIPGYPGQLFPRVLGLIEPPVDRINPRIRHVQSDILDLGDSPGAVVVAHVVNDAAHAWGRRGVAAALASRHPSAARAFRAWTFTSPDHLQLGRTHVIEDHDGTRVVMIVSMVAQQGYGPGAVTRLRYDALRKALAAVADLASRTSASVHIPRIGAGQAGGRWDLIENDLAALLADRGIDVIVHTLPAQASLPGARQ